MACRSTVPKSAAPKWGSALRRAREAVGATQGELARAVGVSGATVSRWEAGATRPDTAARAACRAAPESMAGALPEHSALLGPADIRAARGALGLGRSELAREAGVGASTLRAWEAGEASPRPAGRERLTAALERLRAVATGEAA